MSLPAVSLHFECDVLVVGAGLAGGIAALRAAESGLRVTLVSSEASATAWAQGGIVYCGEGDPERLIRDILNAGCEVNYKPAVEFLARSGPQAVDHWLRDKLGVEFDKGADGHPDLCLEAAHNTRRILHVKDFTGSAISKKLTEALNKNPLISRHPGVLVELLLSNRHDSRKDSQYNSSRVTGAYVFDSKTGQVNAYVAKAVILATGGFSQLYLHSTGPDTSRGDGIAAAHRAGARTLNLEYVQFHPTALFIPGEPRYLLTEALRGAGAKLLNFGGQRFVNELEARDVVSRAIHDELLKSNSSHVWMDLKPVESLAKKFPAIVKLLVEKGFDPEKDLIPVVPAAHYTIGGVWTDLNGATNLPGLFAVGEVACTGVHGANRLASTSLLEAIVFGEKAGEAAAKDAKCVALDFNARPWISEKGEVDPALLNQDWQLLRQSLWNYIGLVRSGRRLDRAEKLLGELRLEIESFYREGTLSTELIGLRNGVLVATLLLYSALRNPTSIGTHFLKTDY